MIFIVIGSSGGILALLVLTYKEMEESHQRRYHFIFDAVDCVPEFLSSTSLVQEMLIKIAELADMKILHGPTVIEGVPENPGVTGFTIIDFSHIAIHTFALTKEICVDLFSCKAFKTQDVYNYLRDKLKVKDEQIKMHRIGVE